MAVGPVRGPTMRDAARSVWTQLTDAQLLAQCAVDTYRASGPGGQKRNKTSSAVRLRHEPSGLQVIAEESRSQHENKARALRRLRVRLYLEFREPPPSDSTWRAGLQVGRRDPRFWPTAATVLDWLWLEQGRLSAAARHLDLSTGQLVDYLAQAPELWAAANHLRRHFELHPLRLDK